jgi:hypothetical protein
MNINAKIFNKILAIEFKKTSKRSHTMTKMVSFQGCKDGSTYINL